MTDPVPFGSFDPQAEVAKSVRDLPHWFQPDVAMFITFRTADSLPRKVLVRQRRELDDWLLRHKIDPLSPAVDAQLAALPSVARSEFYRLKQTAYHRDLDDCHGECVLRRPELAAIVGNSLLHFDQTRYDLDSFVVMPNHVHMLVQFRPPTELRAQCDSWLHFTAREINRVLGRRGSFWQSEPFDHLVRSANQFDYLRFYIADNPNKARLSPDETLYWSRDVRGK